jgi:hypothetical protein
VGGERFGGPLAARRQGPVVIGEIRVFPARLCVSKYKQRGHAAILAREEGVALAV